MILILNHSLSIPSYWPYSILLAPFHLTGPIPSYWPHSILLALFHLTGPIPSSWPHSILLAPFHLTGPIPSSWPYSILLALSHLTGPIPFCHELRTHTNLVSAPLFCVHVHHNVCGILTHHPHTSHTPPTHPCTTHHHGNTNLEFVQHSFQIM